MYILKKKSKVGSIQEHLDDFFLGQVV
jgi:hypothetical protein